MTYGRGALAVSLDNESEIIRAWKLERLAQAGCPPNLAKKLAELPVLYENGNPAPDYTVACSMFEHGATARQVAATLL